MSKTKIGEVSRASVKVAEQSSKEKKRKLHEFDGNRADLVSPIESTQEKEERRERKRQKKEKKEKRSKDEKTKPKAEAPVTSSDNTQDLSEKIARKAAKEERRAEKKRLKALKQERRGEEPKEISRDVQGPVQQREGLNDGVSDGYTESKALGQLPQSQIDDFLKQNHISIDDSNGMPRLRPILEFSYLPSVALTEPSPFASFKTPTPIQAASWPFLLSGRDVIGVAETGSGKTLAFGLPCVRHIKSLRKNHIGKARGSPARAVIVSPTRELAVQIHEQIDKVAGAAGLGTVCVYGGVPKESQRHALKTAQIVVATPGRLNDLVEEGSADLGNVSFVVLDEADRMLDKGFEEAIRKIISSTLPKSSPHLATGTGQARQTLMFTATWPPSVRELAATFMNEPVRINIGEDNPTGELRANTRIKQIVEVVDPRSKEQRMLQLIKQHQSGKNSKDRILVFCLYKKEAQRVENFIRQRGLRVAGIHGDLTQDKRTKSLESFKTGDTPLLVATDVAARGLDIPNVKVVLNVTFPLTAEDYVHRIGRTGRAGADGLAITLFTEHDKAQSGALINVLKAANQAVPEELMKFGSTVKKKQHDTYGAFFKEDTGKKAEKIKFDD